MFQEFVLFIINLCLCLFYCFRTIRQQRCEIARLTKRVNELTCIGEIKRVVDVTRVIEKTERQEHTE